MNVIDYETKIRITKEGRVSIVGNCEAAVIEAVPSVSDDFHIQFWETESVQQIGENFVLTGWGRTTRSY